jgi:hypothetical protein
MSRVKCRVGEFGVSNATNSSHSPLCEVIFSLIPPSGGPLRGMSRNSSCP